MPKGPRLCRLPLVSHEETNQARFYQYTLDARSLKPPGEGRRHLRRDPTTVTSASAFRTVVGNPGRSSYSKSSPIGSATRCGQLARNWCYKTGVQKDSATYEVPTCSTAGLTHMLDPWDMPEEVDMKSDGVWQEMLKTSWPMSAAKQLTDLLRDSNDVSDAQTKQIIENAQVYVDGGDLIKVLKEKVSALIALINDCPVLNRYDTDESFGYGELTTAFEAIVEGLTSVQHDMLSNEYKRALWRSERLKPLIRRFLDQLDDEDRELLDFLSLSRCRVEASLGRHIVKVSQALVKFHGKIVDSKNSSKTLRAFASCADYQPLKEAEMGMRERDTEANSASLAMRVHQFKEVAMRQSEMMERNLAMQEKFNKSIATEAAMIRNWAIKDHLQDTIHHSTRLAKRTTMIFDDAPEATVTQESTRRQSQPQLNEQQEDEAWHTNLDVALARQLARSKRVLHDMEKLDVDKQMYLEDLDVLLAKEYEMANSVCSPHDDSSHSGVGSGTHNLEGSDDHEMVLNQLVLRRDSLQSEVNDLRASLQRELLRLDSNDVDAEGSRSRFASVPRKETDASDEAEFCDQKRGKRPLVVVEAIDDTDYFAVAVRNQVELKGYEVASSPPSSYTAERVDRLESDDALQPKAECGRTPCSPTRESVEGVVAMDSHPSEIAVIVEELTQNVPTERPSSPHPMERSMPMEHDVEIDRPVIEHSAPPVTSPQSTQAPRSPIGGTRLREKYRLALEDVWEELLVGKAIAEEQEWKLHLASTAAEKIRLEAEDLRSMVSTYKEILEAQRRKSSLTNSRTNRETSAAHLRGGSDEVVSCDIKDPIVVDGDLADCRQHRGRSDDDKSHQLESSLAVSISAREVASLNPSQRSSKGRSQTRRRRAGAKLTQLQKEAHLRSVVLEVRLERKRKELARLCSSSGISGPSTHSSKSKVDYDADIFRYWTFLRSANQIKSFWLHRLEKRREGEGQVAVEGPPTATTTGSAEHVPVKTIQVSLLEECQNNPKPHDNLSGGRMRASALSHTEASSSLNPSPRIEQAQTITESRWNHQPRKHLPLAVEEANGDRLLSIGRFRHGSRGKRQALFDTKRDARRTGIKADEFVASQRFRRYLEKLEQNQFGNAIGSRSRCNVKDFYSHRTPRTRPAAVASSTCSASLAGVSNFLKRNPISERNGSNLTEVDIVSRALGGLGYRHDCLREVVGMPPIPAGNVDLSASAFPQALHNQKLTTCFPLMVARSANAKLNAPRVLLGSSMSTCEIGEQIGELETSAAETLNSWGNDPKESISPSDRAGCFKVSSPVCVSNASLRSKREVPADFLCRGHSVLRSCISTENLSECFSLVQSSTTTWPDSVAESLESLPPWSSSRPNTVGSKIRDRCGPQHLEIVAKQLVRPRTTEQKLR